MIITKTRRSFLMNKEKRGKHKIKRGERNRKNSALFALLLEILQNE